jgi:hypothetical protein
VFVGISVGVGVKMGVGDYELLVCVVQLIYLYVFLFLCACMWVLSVHLDVVGCGLSMCVRCGVLLYVSREQINNAVFMKVNSASINMLRLAGPYVTYGSPNLKTVRELVYKRGFACIKKQVFALFFLKEGGFPPPKDYA